MHAQEEKEVMTTDAVVEDTKTDSLSRIVELMNSAPVETLEQLLAESDIGEQNKALVVAGAWAKKLLGRDEFVRLMGSLIAFRRCYAVAYRELQELIEAEGPGVHPMTEDYIVQAAMHKAAQPFSEHDLMQGFADTVLPWIATVVDKHTKRDADAAHKQQQAGEEARRTRPIPSLFPLTMDSDPWLRDRSLVLIGWRNAVQYVLDRVVEYVLKDRTHQHMVIWLGANYARSHHDSNRMIWVGPKSWNGCGDTNDSVRTMIVEAVVPKLSAMPDLLVCEDLTKAYTKGFVGRPAAANAGDGHKRMRDWCNKAGCGILGAVPLDLRGNPDTRAPELEQLRTFTNLRAVSLVEKAEDLDEDKVRIVVGTSLVAFDVFKETLNSYLPSTLVVPS